MKHALLCFIGLFFFTSASWANDSLTEVEARYLTQVTQELGYLQRLVEQARYHRNPAAAYQVDYEALQADLTTIREHLTRHIQKPSRVPRSLPSLPLKSHAK